MSTEKIDLVVDIARHLCDEAGKMLDQEFDAEYQPAPQPAKKSISLALASKEDDCGCTPTANGNPCC